MSKVHQPHDPRILNVTVLRFTGNDGERVFFPVQCILYWAEYWTEHHYDPEFKNCKSIICASYNSIVFVQETVEQISDLYREAYEHVV